MQCLNIMNVGINTKYISIQIILNKKEKQNEEFI